MSIHRFSQGYIKVDDNLTDSGGIWSGGTAVTSGGTAHTKGAWAEAVASLAEDVHLIRIMVAPTFGNGTNTATMLDLGIGAAASEQVIIPDLAVGFMGGSANCFWADPIYVPVTIPAGTRVAVRTQSVQTSHGDTVFLDFLRDPSGSPPFSYGKWERITTSTNSGGVKVNPGNAAEGSWVELTSSSNNHYGALICRVQVRDDASLGSEQYHLDLGIGAAASEVVILENIPFQTFTSELIDGGYGTFRYFYPLSNAIPAGTRIAARIHSSSTTSDDPDINLYGMVL